ncbi:MAG: cupin domain-containing protein [Desulfobacterales bacterium]|nr:cupin domain-containing protein [Desulfobacterales bacterium]
MNKRPQPVPVVFEDDGIFPNNSRVPLVLYPSAFGHTPEPDRIEHLVTAKGWVPAWRYTVYPYHHYHTTAHEFLVCYKGQGRVLFGGDGGQAFDIKPGDAVMIPAGVAHKCLKDKGLAMVGSYPPGQSPDMNYGRPEERPAADQNIQDLSFPKTDPVSGLAFEWGTGD